MGQHTRLPPQCRAVPLAVISMLAACTDQTAPGEGPVIVQATAVEIPLPGAAPVIRYRIDNVGPRPVFILACGERLVAELEQRRAAGAGWVPADAAVRCPANLLYLPVAVRAHSGGEGNISAPAGGTYRLRVRYRVGHPEGRAEAATSAPVEVLAS